MDTTIVFRFLLPSNLYCFHFLTAHVLLASKLCDIQSRIIISISIIDQMNEKLYFEREANYYRHRFCTVRTLQITCNQFHLIVLSHPCAGMYICKLPTIRMHTVNAFDLSCETIYDYEYSIQFLCGLYLVFDGK